jgi:3-hydroxyisobutyrate dehydrogenase-like beta-hydroxyacid dehydrogenase
MGAQMAALAEGMALAERCELDQVTLLEVRRSKRHKLKLF